MLQKAGLRRHDTQAGQEGYTLAAALLLGKDEVIKSVLPHYKIDALVRKVNTDRYDDRDYIDTNLIEAYDRLIDFTTKHLPDKFYMEGDQRVSLRAKIFREVVANLIVHREYTSGLAASFIIYKDRVETGNANNPHGDGLISPDNFAPFSKNPLIAKFFTQLGRVDEIGSGVLNVNKYLPVYAPGKKPQFIEGSSFKMIIPLDVKLFEEFDRVSDIVTEGVTEGVKEKLTELLQAITDKEGLKTDSYADILGIPKKSIERYIKQLKEAGLIEFRGAPKTGGYYLIKTVKTKVKK